MCVKGDEKMFMEILLLQKNDCIHLTQGTGEYVESMNLLLQQDGRHNCM